jgi:hypothetical protein
MKLNHYLKKENTFHLKGYKPICTICFVASKLYKKIERKLKQNKIPLSVDKVLNISKTITTLKVKLLQSGVTMSKLMILTPKQKSINVFFDDKIWEK